jgi:catechol 2,3-dioxygenase
MDAINPSASPTFASRTPLHIDAVGLAVRDVERVAAFYRNVLGLRLISQEETVRLGVDGVVLLELLPRPEAPPDDKSSAGLYHTAFLMPTRADLARWVLHIARERAPITGASDHGVSEAFYLDDPEGNGVEVYADRPPETWKWTDGLVSMPTKRLDVDDLLSTTAPESSFAEAPAGLRIGHIHLRVGDLAIAESFYSGVIGLDLTRRRDGAAFMSSGGYHHHVAGNVWHSAGAGARDLTRAGLAWFSLTAGDLPALRARLDAANVPLTATATGLDTTDPWGTPLRIHSGDQSPR